MNYYQARIAIDTAELLEDLKRLYEEKLGVTVTKGMVVMKAYEDSEWVTDWKIVNKKIIKLENRYEIKPNHLKLRIQISEEVEEGIKNLKNTLPKDLGVRSVTIGVCLRLILKAAYIKNTEKEEYTDTLNNLFNKYKKKANDLFNEENSNQVISLLEELQKEIER